MAECGCPTAFRGVLCLMLGIILLTLCACQQLKKISARKPAHAVWSQPHSFNSYLQRRCTPVAGPDQPAVAARQTLGEGAELDTVLLRPEGGVVLCTLTNADAGDDPKAPRQPERYELRALDSAGSETWKSQFSSGDEFVSPMVSFTNLSQQGDTFYAYSRLLRRWQTPAEKKVDSGSTELYRFSVGRAQPELRKFSGEFWTFALTDEAGGLYGFGFNTWMLTTRPEDWANQDVSHDMQTRLTHFGPNYESRWEMKRVLALGADASSSAPSLSGKSTPDNPIVVSDNGLTFWAEDGSGVTCYSNTGEALWERKVDDHLTASPLLRSDGSIVLASGQVPYPNGMDLADKRRAAIMDHYFNDPQRLECYDATGRKLWDYKTGGGLFLGTQLACAEDNSIVFNEVHRLPKPDRERNQVQYFLCKVDAGGRRVFSQALPRDGKLYTDGELWLDSRGRIFWSADHTLIIFATQGQELRRIDLAAELSAGKQIWGMMLGVDGKVYVWNRQSLLILEDKS